jgi:hypothetical protein
MKNPGELLADLLASNATTIMFTGTFSVPQMMIFPTCSHGKPTRNLIEQAARVKPFEHVINMKMRNRKVAMCFKKHFPLDAARECSENVQK